MRKPSLLNPVHSWCFTRRHVIVLAECPVTHIWILACQTCKGDPDGDVLERTD